ncbi:MAG: M66 family metalloprotease [Nannocystaceae bacterium]
MSLRSYVCETAMAPVLAFACVFPACFAELDASVLGVTGGGADVFASAPSQPDAGGGAGASAGGVSDSEAGGVKVDDEGDVAGDGDGDEDGDGDGDGDEDEDEHEGEDGDDDDDDDDDDDAPGSKAEGGGATGDVGNGEIDPGIEYDFDCVKIDRVGSPQMVPPAGMQLGFRVLDCAGNPVPLLTRASFELVDDVTGDRFDVGPMGGSTSSLALPSDYGLYSVLALDLSASVSDVVAVDEVVDAALAYVDAIDDGPGGAIMHEFAVVVFGQGSESRLLQDFVMDHELVRAQIESLRGSVRSGLADLYGAYLRSLQLLGTRGDGVARNEKFLVVFAGGTQEDGGDGRLREKAMTSKRESGASIYTIGMRPIADMAKIAELASSEQNHVVVERPDQLRAAVLRAANRANGVVRSNYVIGVCTPARSGEPSVTMSVRMEGNREVVLFDTVTLFYPTTQLDGSVAWCDAEDIVSGRLSCDDSSVCEISCLQMECGCDQLVSCGLCRAGLRCSDDNACVEGEGPGAGSENCSRSDQARGIRFGTVEANQGVGVDLAVAGSVVSHSDRNAKLVAGREMLVRAGWSLAPDWQAREIEARLHIVYEGGDASEIRVRKFVETVSNFSSLATSFSWMLSEDMVREGMRYRLSLHEVDDAMSDTSLPAPFPRVPAIGTADLGVEGNEQVIRVVLVAVAHTYRHCTVTGDAAAVLGGYRDILYATYPLNDVQMRVRDEALEWEGELDIDGWIELLGAISQARAKDDAPAEVYYYGVLSPCVSTMGIAGIGYVPGSPKEPAAARYRTAVGVASAWTFVHELGHNHGRRHVECSGAEGNSDADYPHVGGRTGVWGFDQRTGELYDDQHTDFMSYCSDDWVSDYGWNQVSDVIQAVGLWARGSESRASRKRKSASGMILAGILHPTGARTWWTEPGSVDPASLDARGPSVDIWAGEELLGRMRAEYTLLSDDQSLSIVLNVPRGFERATHIEHIDPQALRHLHSKLGAPRTLTPLDSLRRHNGWR